MSENPFKGHKPTAPRTTLGELSAFRKIQEEAIGFKRTQNNIQFENLIKGRFDLIPRGFAFRSELPGIEQVSIFASPDKKSMFSILSFRGLDGRRVDETTYFTPDGSLSMPEGKLAKFHKDISPEDIYAEVMRGFLESNLPTWRGLDLEINSPGKELGGKEKGGGGGGGPRGPKGIADTRRWKFLLEQKGLLFPAYDEVKGFAGYRAFFFQNFAITESDKVGNATYFIDFDEAIDSKMDKHAISRLSNDELQTLVLSIPGIEKIGWPRSKKRQEMMQRIEHREKRKKSESEVVDDIENVAWMKHIQDAIDQRLKKIKTGQE
jgi:hypothetical protein